MTTIKLPLWDSIARAPQGKDLELDPKIIKAAYHREYACASSTTKFQGCRIDTQADKGNLTRFNIALSVSQIHALLADHSCTAQSEPIQPKTAPAAAPAASAASSTITALPNTLEHHKGV